MGKRERDGERDRYGEKGVPERKMLCREGRKKDTKRIPLVT